jgi:hypothetical protein
MVWVNMAENKKKSPRKERFRNFSIKFNEPLSNLVLATLPEKTSFISKYRDFNIIKNNDNIVGMLFKDSLDIFYNLSSEELRTSSPVRNDEKVIERLEETAKRIFTLFELEDSQYKLIEGDDFQYVEDYDIQNKIENNLIENLQSAFEDEGAVNLAGCVFVLRTEDKEIPIRLTFPTQEDFDNNRLLIECDKNYLKKIVEIINK